MSSHKSPVGFDARPPFPHEVHPSRRSLISSPGWQESQSRPVGGSASEANGSAISIGDIYQNRPKSSHEDTSGVLRAPKHARPMSSMSSPTMSTKEQSSKRPRLHNPFSSETKFVTGRDPLARHYELGYANPTSQTKGTGHNDNDNAPTQSLASVAKDADGGINAKSILQGLTGQARSTSCSKDMFAPSPMVPSASAPNASLFRFGDRSVAPWYGTSRAISQSASKFPLFSTPATLASHQSAFKKQDNNCPGLRSDPLVLPSASSLTFATARSHAPSPFDSSDLLSVSVYNKPSSSSDSTSTWVGLPAPTCQSVVKLEPIEELQSSTTFLAPKLPSQQCSVIYLDDAGDLTIFMAKEEFRTCARAVFGASQMVKEAAHTVISFDQSTKYWIAFPDVEDHPSLKIILMALHFHYSQIPENLDYRQVTDMIRVSNKYGFHRAMEAPINAWVKALSFGGGGVKPNGSSVARTLNSQARDALNKKLLDLLIDLRAHGSNCELNNVGAKGIRSLGICNSEAVLARMKMRRQECMRGVAEKFNHLIDCFRYNTPNRYRNNYCPMARCKHFENTAPNQWRWHLFGKVVLALMSTDIFFELRIGRLGGVGKCMLSLGELSNYITNLTFVDVENCCSPLKELKRATLQCIDQTLREGMLRDDDDILLPIDTAETVKKKKNRRKKRNKNLEYATTVT